MVEAVTQQSVMVVDSNLREKLLDDICKYVEAHKTRNYTQDELKNIDHIYQLYKAGKI